MRVSRFFPLVSSLLTVLALPCRAGWGGPAGTAAAGAGVAVGNPVAGGFSNGRGVMTPLASGGSAGLNRGPVTAAPAGAFGPRGATTPGMVPAGIVPAGVRYAPITAGARPVGTVVTPRLGGMPAPVPRVVRPNPPGNFMTPGPVDRPNVPVAATNARIPARRLPTLAPGGNFRNGIGPGVPARFEPGRDRWGVPFRAGLSDGYPGDIPGGLRPGHYVPGESYVQDVGTSVYLNSTCLSPTYYLGGAFPYFYGASPAFSGFYPGTGNEGFAPSASLIPAPVPAAETPNPAPGPGQAPAPSGPPSVRRDGVTPPRPGHGGPGQGMNSLVEAVQAELLQRGYFGGRPDGVFGVDTGDALRGFQENHGLARTGLINEATLFALGLN